MGKGNNYTKIADLVTGSEGSAYITVDGENRYFFELAKVEASIEFTIIAKKLLGHRMKQHKVVGAEGKGTFRYLQRQPRYPCDFTRSTLMREKVPLSVFRPRMRIPVRRLAAELW